MKTEAETRQTRRYVISAAIMAALFVVLVLLNVQMGSVSIPFRDTLRVLIHGGEDETFRSILFKIRLPRMTASILLGGALALAGFLLQTFFNNPIAGPFVLGVSSGAKLTVALLMVLALSRGYLVTSAMMIAAAFVGAMISMSFVLTVSQRVPSASMLIVSGVMIGYICSAATDFVVTFADDASIVNLHNWSLGSFSGISWEDVRVMAVVVSVAFAAIFLMSKSIGAYQLGEGYAKSVGLNLRLFRALLVVLSSILAACVTAFAGPVSFVGIAAPHLVKAILKTSKPLVVIPACFLGGAIFCLGCDLIARTAFSPTELSVSSVTAVFGAPVVIAVMLRRRKDG